MGENDKFNSGGIHQLKCSEWGKKYTGQTGIIVLCYIILYYIIYKV
jgi:hypothetical protein